MPESKRPCLHCAIRDTVFAGMEKDADLSIDEMVDALAEVTGEFIGMVDDPLFRESLLHSALGEISGAILTAVIERENASDPKPAEDTDSGVRH